MICRNRLFIKKLTANPKRLFLIDGLGALLTAIFLTTILIKFEHQFGMPKKMLYFLSLLACLYAIYSFCCYFFTVKHWQNYLKGIMIANMLYCFLTIGLVFYYYQKLTILGLTYFILELTVISGLIMIELAVLSISTNSKT